jgi:hypothetical protein
VEAPLMFGFEGEAILDGSEPEDSAIDEHAAQAA